MEHQPTTFSENSVQPIATFNADLPSRGRLQNEQAVNKLASPHPAGQAPRRPHCTLLGCYIGGGPLNDMGSSRKSQIWPRAFRKELKDLLQGGIICELLPKLSSVPRAAAVVSTNVTGKTVPDKPLCHLRSLRKCRHPPSNKPGPGGGDPWGLALASPPAEGDNSLVTTD